MLARVDHVLNRGLLPEEHVQQIHLVGNPQTSC